jgi:hypothetical protein
MPGGAERGNRPISRYRARDRPAVTRDIVEAYGGHIVIARRALGGASARCGPEWREQRNGVFNGPL